MGKGKTGGNGAQWKAGTREERDRLRGRKNVPRAERNGWDGVWAWN